MFLSLVVWLDLLAGTRSVEEIATVFYEPLIESVKLVLHNTATFSPKVDS
jgi:hypothetical protein